MWACKNGHIDIAHMLVGEYQADIEIRNKVRAVRLLSMLYCIFLERCLRLYLFLDIFSVYIYTVGWNLVSVCSSIVFV